MTPQPSANKKPSRSRSKGREAFLGSSLRRVRQLILSKAVTTIGVSGASAPPVTMTSARSAAMRSKAAPMASIPAVQPVAIVVQKPFKPDDRATSLETEWARKPPYKFAFAAAASVSSSTKAGFPPLRTQRLLKARSM